MKITSRSGFSLVELIVALVLVSFLSMAIFELAKNVIFSYSKEWKIRKLSGDSVYTLENIKSSVRSASVLVEPVVGGSTSRLLGYINVDPADLSGRLAQTEPQSYFLYCFSQDNGAIYKYSGDYPPTITFNSFYCGKPAETGQSMEVMAGEMKNAAVSYLFLRDPENLNIVNINYTLSLGGATVTGDTSVSLQKSL